MMYTALKTLELPGDVDANGRAVKRRPGENIPAEVMKFLPEATIKRMLERTREISCDYKDGEKRPHEMDSDAGWTTIVDTPRQVSALRARGVSLEDFDPGDPLDKKAIAVAYDVLIMGRDADDVIKAHLGEEPSKDGLKRVKPLLAKTAKAAAPPTDNKKPQQAA